MTPHQNLLSKIRELFGWIPRCDIRFMYASGRHLRPATLDDVENAVSWDCETIRTLIGSGCLYVTKESDSILLSSSSDEEPTPVEPVEPTHVEVSLLLIFVPIAGMHLHYRMLCIIIIGKHME